MKQRKELFKIYCPYIRREVILYEDTWFYKITHDHPEMRNKVKFLQETLETKDKSVLIYRKRRNEHEMALYRECFHFMPYYRYLKIGFRILDGKFAVVTTVHGQHSGPPKDMERV